MLKFPIKNKIDKLNRNSNYISSLNDELNVKLKFRVNKSIKVLI